VVSNTIYRSRDIRNRINRRIVKVDIIGSVIYRGNYDVKKTIYNYNNINYLPAFLGIIKGEVDSYIIPILAAIEDSEDSEGDRTIRKRRVESLLVEAISRRTKNRARTTSVRSTTPLVGY